MIENIFKKNAYIQIKHVIDCNSEYDYLPSEMNIVIRTHKHFDSLSGIPISKDNIKNLLAQLFYCKHMKVKITRLETEEGWFVDIPKWAYDTLINQISNYFNEWMWLSRAKEILEIEDKDDKSNKKQKEKLI